MEDVIITVLQVVALVAVAVGAGVVVAATVGGALGAGLGVLGAGLALLAAASIADLVGR